MLSSILLQFQNAFIKIKYGYVRQKFYQKVIPVIAIMLLVLSVVIEINYRIYNVGDISVLTSCINWCFLGVFIVLSVAIRYGYWASWLVSPILYIFIHYYFGYVDYADNTKAMLYFR